MITDNAAALRILMVEDLYMIPDAGVKTQENNEELPPPLYFDYLGENNQYLLIVVDYPSDTYISEDGLHLLRKILAAKKMDTRDIALLNISKHPSPTFDALKDFFGSKRILLFGVAPQQAGLPALSANKTESYRDVHLLATYSLTELDADVQKKQLFWNVFKSF